MSTKCSIAHGIGFHLYNDSFDDEHVFLQLDHSNFTVTPDSLVVNVARGQLVDEDALIDALRAGRLGGAALDVYAQEPTDPARWVDVPHCILTPHTGGATDAAVAQMAQMLLANIRAFVAEEPLPNAVI